MLPTTSSCSNGPQTAPNARHERASLLLTRPTVQRSAASRSKPSGAQTSVYFKFARVQVAPEGRLLDA
jgi:hypothetical protein